MLVSLEPIVGRVIQISGKKLATKRNALFMTQDELGAKVGMSGGSIRRIEGESVAGVLRKNIPALAAALKIPLEEIEVTLAPDADEEHIPGPLQLTQPHDEAIRRAAEALASLEKTTPDESLRRAIQRLGLDQPQQQLKKVSGDPRLRNAAKPMGPRGPGRQ